MRHSVHISWRNILPEDKKDPSRRSSPPPMLAANQAPIIMLRHEKVEVLRDGQWGELLAIQNEQLKLLERLIEKITVDQ